MMKIRQLWSAIHGSFWFVPSLLLMLSIVLAVVLIDVDFTGRQQWLAHWPRLFGAGAAGARGMLSTIAGSMMTVVGVTFSMVLVTLTLASSQYTSRILRNFMRDRLTQLVLGFFAGIFVYCLIVLRTIRGGDEDGFVPSLAVSFAVLLAIGGISVLVLFLHHIASSIQASHIIAAVAAETLGTIDRLFPQKLGQEPADTVEDPAPLALPERNWQVVSADKDGYIQSVDNAILLRLARENKTIVRMERGIGEFVIRDTPLASLALTSPLEKTLIAAVKSAYWIGRHRTAEQDSAFGVRQIVDMALRALSPGINDTTTAMMCVDHLTAILARLASRSIPSSHRYEAGQLRIIALGPTFGSMMADSFDQIRGSARGNVALLIRMLDALQTIGSRTANPGRLRSLREEVQRIAEVAEDSLKSVHERAQLVSHLERVRNAL